jgi:hypothetical protein
MNVTSVSGVDQLVLVHPLIRVWSGTMKADRTKDLMQKASGELPPVGIVDDARKRVICSRKLAGMVNVRKKLERTLASAGYRFLGGFAIPETKLAETLATVDTLEAEFESAKAEFESGFDASIQEWAKQWPDWQSLFADAPTAAQVTRKCRFRVALFKMGDPGPGAESRYGDALADALPALLHDIAGHAQKLWETQFKGRLDVTQKQKQAVKALVSKLAQFGMLDPRITPSATNLTLSLDALPRTGRLSQTQSTELGSLLLTLTQPQRLLQHGQAVFATAQGSLSLDADDDDEDAVPTLDADAEMSPVVITADVPTTPVEPVAPVVLDVPPVPVPSRAPLTAAAFAL